MMTAEIIGGFVTISGAAIAGWFAYLTKKASARSPETVAGGYTVLVSDMRAELARLSERVLHLEEERKTLTKQMDGMKMQVEWLLDNVSEDDYVRFNAYFKKE